MSKRFNGKVFSYIEPFADRTEANLPSTLKLDSISQECLLFRLLLGTLDVEKYDGTIHKQRHNYAIIPYTINDTRGINSIYQTNVPIKGFFDNFNKYMNSNRKNTWMYQQVLFEYSNYFDQQCKGDHINAFVHLYRALEYVSYCFPLIYVSKSGEYKKSYDALKAFLSDEQKSELKFFRHFLDTLFSDSSILDLKADIEITAPNRDMIDEYKRIILLLTDGSSAEINNDIFSIKYRDLFDFWINLRNKYFHNLLGSTNINISSTNIDTNDFFRCINEIFASWLAYIYFSIVKYGVENT